MFIDGGIHTVDMLVNFGGFPERVYAATPPRLLDNAEGEDGMVMTGHLPNSAIGLITYSSGTLIRQGRQVVSVTGAKGQLKFSPHGDEIILETPGGDETIRVPEARQGVRDMVQEFRASILEDRVPLMSGDEALKDLTVVLAAYESVLKGQEVKLTPA